MRRTGPRAAGQEAELPEAGRSHQQESALRRNDQRSKDRDKQTSDAGAERDGAGSVGQVPDPSGSAGPTIPDDGSAADRSPSPAGSSPAREGRAAGEEGDSDRQLAAEYLDQLQRLKAEFDNYRRRTLREREEWGSTARGDLVRRLLPVLDDLRRARRHQEQGGAPDAAGLFLILKSLEEILNQLGLEEEVAELGTEFDPELQEAVMAVPSEEVPAGRVIFTMEPGYSFEGRQIRPSKVSVSSGPATEP